MNDWHRRQIIRLCIWCAMTGASLALIISGLIRLALGA
jgi:hypothetical protein